MMKSRPPRAAVTFGCDFGHSLVREPLPKLQCCGRVGLEKTQEEIMRVMKFISLVVILLTISVFAVAQQTPAQTAPSVKHVPIANTAPNSGVQMFDSYCAVCHGKDGKGSGPAASAMKTPPIDLTLLAKKAGGKYPAAHVAAVIRGQATTPAHGSEDMPVWGPLFSSISQGHASQVQQRVANLVAYIDTLQAK
jgi:mono/diheme cytochrome c family protein